MFVVQTYSIEPHSSPRFPLFPSVPISHWLNPLAAQSNKRNSFHFEWRCVELEGWVRAWPSVNFMIAPLPEYLKRLQLAY